MTNRKVKQQQHQQNTKENSTTECLPVRGNEYQSKRLTKQDVVKVFTAGLPRCFYCYRNSLADRRKRGYFLVQPFSRPSGVFVCVCVLVNCVCVCCACRHHLSTSTCVIATVISDQNTKTRKGRTHFVFEFQNKEEDKVK